MKKTGNIPKVASYGFISIFLLILGFIAIAWIGCGGGGGDDDVQDTPFSGGSGTGAGDVGIFWRYFGEVGSAYAVDETSDGGFIFAGEQGTDYAFDTMDLFLAKTDSQGNTEWQKTFGETEGQRAQDVKQTSDGGYIVVGYTYENINGSSSSDVYVIKTDASGNQQWANIYDAGSYDEGHAVCVLDDGYAIAGVGTYDSGGGYFDSSAWFFKIDENGNKIQGSDRFYGPAGPHNKGHSMQKTRDGGFILAGQDNSGGAFIIKLAANGDEVWSGVYSTGLAHSVCQLPSPDNGFIVAGDTSPAEPTGNEEDKDVLVIKVDENGSEVWHKVFGGSDMDIGYGVVAASDGGCLVAGLTRSYSSSNYSWGKEDVYLIRLDNDGNSIWQKVKGMAPNNSEMAHGAVTASDGGLVVAGGAQAQVMLAKFDQNGDTVTLGDMDFTFTVPETIGLITPANAADVASVAGSAVTLPIRVGGFTLDRFIDGINGVPAGNLCTDAGTYTWTPTPALPVSTGNSYVLSFSNCQEGAAPDMLIYQGSLTMTVDSLSGDVSGTDYDINVSIEDVALTFTDDIGDSSIQGDLAYSRISTSGNFAERAHVSSGDNIIFSDDDDTETLTQIDINSTLATSGAFSFGNIGQKVIIDPDFLTGALTVELLQPISGTQLDSPTQGKLLVTAQDGSNLTVTVSNGDVSIDVDTNNDGTVDGTIITTWDEMN